MGGSLAEGILSNQRIRVLLADDHLISLESLSQYLSHYSDIEVVGGASNGLVAIEMARSLQPDVVIMDITMPIMNGIEATHIISTEMPSVHVIGLSMYDEADVADRMLAAGAVDYLCKSGPPENLIAAIRRARVLSHVFQ